MKDEDLNTPLHMAVIGTDPLLLLIECPSRHIAMMGTAMCSFQNDLSQLGQLFKTVQGNKTGKVDDMALIWLQKVAL